MEIGADVPRAQTGAEDALAIGEGLRACLRRGNGPGTSHTRLPLNREHGHHGATTDLPLGPDR